MHYFSTLYFHMKCFGTFSQEEIECIHHILYEILYLQFLLDLAVNEVLEKKTL